VASPVFREVLKVIAKQLYTQLASKGMTITVFTRASYVNLQNDAYKGIKLIHVDCPRNKF